MMLRAVSKYQVVVVDESASYNYLNVVETIVDDTTPNESSTVPISSLSPAVSSSAVNTTEIKSQIASLMDQVAKLAAKL
jgi:hypothetical protein